VESVEKIDSFASLVWNRFKKHRLALASLSILIALCTTTLMAGLIEAFLGVSHDLASLDLINLAPSSKHILGTNELGQDVLTRLIFGGRISLAVGIISALTSAIIGAVIGIAAGFYGGRIDTLLMRFTDAMLSVPVLPLMIVFAALDLEVLFGKSDDLTTALLICGLITSLIVVFQFASATRSKHKQANMISPFINGLLVGIFFMGSYFIIFRFIDWNAVGSGNFSSVIKLIMIIVFFGWMTVARLARAAVLQLKQMEFVVAARALGAKNSRLMMAHILPNALASIIVASTLEVGGNILYEAALSFLGLGIQPPVSSWGNMLNNAVDYIKTNPMLAFWPGLMILITVASFNFLGDGMRDALDPHQVMKSSD